MPVNDFNLSCCGRGFDSRRLHHLRKEYENRISRQVLLMKDIVLLSSKKMADVESYTSVELCLESLKNDNLTNVFIIGGEMIYKSFFNYSHILHL